MAHAKDHIVELRKNAASHVSRLTELRQIIRRAEEEADVHETLLALAQDERLLELVAEYREDPDHLVQAAEAYLSSASLKTAGFSPSATFDFSSAQRSTQRATVQLHCGRWLIEVGWDREVGFLAIPDTRGLRQQVAFLNYVHLERETDEDDAAVDE